nr:hypothetical protein [Mucilaginibacter sp. FT3.2]
MKLLFERLFNSPFELLFVHKYQVIIKEKDCYLEPLKGGHVWGKGERILYALQCCYAWCKIFFAIAQEIVYPRTSFEMSFFYLLIGI